MENLLDKVKDDLLAREDELSIYATKSRDVIRLKDVKEDIRPAFFHDIDTIIYSNPYSRYMDKTQVFSYLENDHVSKRMLHVQFVSKIARTIGRCLNLNQDLIEAIALGHDIGHTPLGHTGERFLNDISLRELGIPFMHNLQSVRVFKDILNVNLSIQTLDGMMCHNGEILECTYEPIEKSKAQFLDDYSKASLDANYSKKLRPMTLEGCVVRVSDVIAYIGRDIEDAIRLNRLDINDVPEDITKVLGCSNREIINNIILDIVKNSYGKNAVIMSEDIFKALNRLKKFNYQYIYNNANTKEDLAYYEKGMNKMFYSFLSDLELKNYDSLIYKVFLDNSNANYINNTNNKQIVIDFISGMTDDYFLNVLETVN